MNYEYISAKEASVILECSRRAAHNILHGLFEDKRNKKNPLAKSIVENGRLKHYYRKDAVLKRLNRARVSKYRKTCVHCKKKFDRVGKENACPECSKRFDKEPNKWYDLTALRALLLVVTSDRAWKIATKSIIIFWIVVIGMIILGGI